MSIDNAIDELLRSDEAELREKRKRLRAFATSVTEYRSKRDETQELATALVDSGALSRADLTRIYELTKAERVAIFQTSRRGAVAGSEADDEQGETAGQ